MQLESTPGEGSTFYYDLQIKPVNDKDVEEIDKAPVINTTEEAPVSHSEAFTVLVAEDSVVNMQLVAAVMEKTFPKVTVVKATNGSEAIDYFRDKSPDVVFMDIQMPEKNGYEATKKIRTMEKYDRQTPIIAFTAGSIKEDQQKCLNAGMDDFLAKPVLPETLEKMVLKWINYAPVKDGTSR